MQYVTACLLFFDSRMSSCLSCLMHTFAWATWTSWRVAVCSQIVDGEHYKSPPETSFIPIFIMSTPVWLIFPWVQNIKKWIKIPNLKYLKLSSKQSDTCLIGFPWCTKTWLTKQLCELSLLIFPYTPFPSSYLFYLHRSAPKEDIFSISNTYMNGSGSTTVFITLF